MQALNLAEVELSGRFRFSHQLWQEYFAARQIRDLPGAVGAEWPDLAPPVLEPMEEVLAGLAWVGRSGEARSVVERRSAAMGD